ncbi:MAG: DUF2232 domain-containing protein [Spirochaetaceae bacterium]
MNARDVWIEAAVLSVVSAFLYQSALFVFVFLVPLAALGRRRGADWLGTAALVTGGVVAATRVTGLIRLDIEWDFAILLMEVLPPAAFLGGLYLLETRLLYGVRRLYRLIQAILIVGAVSVPVILTVSSSSVAMDTLRQQFELLHTMLTGGETDPARLGRFATVGAMMEAVLDLLLSTYLFAYTVVLAGNWYLGQLIGARTQGEEGFRIRDFRLPDIFVWVLVAASGAALVGLVGNAGVFEHLAWNALFVALFLYGVQGLGIVWSLLDRFEVARGIRVGVGAALAILLLVPGANMLVMLGLPGLGVAETWIHFRSTERS